jgi:hypothetical protein
MTSGGVTVAVTGAVGGRAVRVKVAGGVEVAGGMEVEVAGGVEVGGAVLVDVAGGIAVAAWPDSDPALPLLPPPHAPSDPMRATSTAIRTTDGFRCVMRFSPCAPPR